MWKIILMAFYNQIRAGAINCIAAEKLKFSARVCAMQYLRERRSGAQMEEMNFKTHSSQVHLIVKKYLCIYSKKQSHFHL